MNAPKVRLGDLGKMIRGFGIRRNETVPEGLPCIRYGEIYTSYNVVLDRPRSFVPPSLYEKCPHIKKGDLVLALTGENKEEIAKSLAYLGEEEIAAGGDTAVWTGHGCDPLYLAYMMYSPRIIKAKADASNGHIVVHASVKKLQQIEVSLPPLSEQRKIAASVDKAMKRVDAIERQFEKLRETAVTSRNSVFTEAFSAIDCDAIRLDEVCEISRGKSKQRPRNDPRLFGGEYPFIQTGDIRAAQGEVISSCDQYYSDFGLRQSRLWPAGTICVTIAANIGESAILGFDACFPDSVVGLLPKDGRLSREYLNAFMIYSKPRLERRAPGTAQKNANIKMLSEIEIPLPDRRDQYRVVELIASTKSRSDKIMSLSARGLANCARMRKAILAEAFAV